MIQRDVIGPMHRLGVGIHEIVVVGAVGRESNIHRSDLIGASDWFVHSTCWMIQRYILGPIHRLGVGMHEIVVVGAVGHGANIHRSDLIGLIDQICLVQAIGSSIRPVG